MNKFRAHLPLLACATAFALSAAATPALGRPQHIDFLSYSWGVYALPKPPALKFADMPAPSAAPGAEHGTGKGRMQNFSGTGRPGRHSVPLLQKRIGRSSPRLAK